MSSSCGGDFHPLAEILLKSNSAHNPGMSRSGAGSRLGSGVNSLTPRYSTSVGQWSEKRAEELACTRVLQFSEHWDTSVHHTLCSGQPSSHYLLKILFKHHDIQMEVKREKGHQFHQKHIARKCTNPCALASRQHAIKWARLLQDLFPLVGQKTNWTCLPIVCPRCHFPYVSLLLIEMLHKRNIALEIIQF